MTISVRMDPLLEKELEMAAKRQGVTKSQFVIDAVERALGHKNPYELMVQAKAEVAAQYKATEWVAAFAESSREPYDTERSRQNLIAKLRAKHGLSAD